MDSATREINKASDKINAARSDFWEAGYLTGTYGARKDAKRRARRARRRLDRAIVREIVA